LDTSQLSAYLLLAGAVALLAGFAVGLGRSIYRTQNFNERIAIINASKTRWIASQALFATSAVLSAAGFFELNIWLYGRADPWPFTLGAGAMIISAISGVLFVYRQTTDPLSSYQGAFRAFEFVYYWLAVGGLLLFGVAFLQADMPVWLGYLTVAAASAYAIFLAASDVGFATPGLVFILTLVIAIVLLGQ
jgi:hypothetical protein